MNGVAIASRVFHFMNLKEYLESETMDIFEALAAIDRAADKLYEYTDFHDVRMVQNFWKHTLFLHA